MLRILLATVAGACAMFFVGCAAIIAEDMRAMVGRRRRAALKTVIVLMLAACTQVVALSIITSGAWR